MDPVAWRAEVDGTVVRLAVVEETVYAGCGAQIIALDAATGQTRWRAHTGRPGPFRVAGGSVYATGGGLLRALDARTGAERWRFAGAVPLRPALAAGHRLCVIGDSPRWGRTLHVLSARTGKEKWRMEADPKLSAPAATGDLVFVGCADGALLAVRARDGRERWRVEPERWHPQWPRRGGGVEVLGAGAGVVYLAGLPYLPPPPGFVAAVAADTGRTLWQTVAGYDPGTGRPDEGDPPVAPVAGGLCVAEPGRLTYLSSGTGQAQVFALAADARCSPPVLTGGVVCAGTGDQWVEAFDAVTGRLEWAVQDPLRPPSGPIPVGLYRDRLIIGGHRCVYQVDPRTGGAGP